MTLNGTTVTANEVDSPGLSEGGGLAVTSATSVELANSIVAGNIDTSSSAPECNDAATYNSLGHNLVGDNRGCDFSATTGDRVGDVAGGGNAIDPVLAALADNGGPTRTHALQDGSPAIDAGNPNPVASATPPACEPADQRGQGRPQDGDGDGGAVCDIGAYELRSDDSGDDSGGGGDGSGGGDSGGGGGALGMLGLLLLAPVWRRLAPGGACSADARPGGPSRSGRSPGSAVCRVSRGPAEPPTRSGQHRPRHTGTFADPLARADAPAIGKRV